MARLALDEITRLAIRALVKAGAVRPMAQATAEALVAADAEGLAGHGLSRLPLYAGHLRTGRADGKARPEIVRRKGGTCLVDAHGGLAFLATRVAVREAVRRAQRYGISFAGVTNSHHLGAAAYHLAPVAAAGLVGLAFTNSPAAINAWGGKKALFGTNPIAAVFPRGDRPPLVIDLSLTEVVRGKIMLYAKENKPIPLGWAVDKDGVSTTDAKAALTGSLFAIGGVKGTMLALMVEVLCAVLTGAGLSFENDSYFEPGNHPRIGHSFIVIDPAALAGGAQFAERLETLVRRMLQDEGVRLPGTRRQQAMQDAAGTGIEVPDALLNEIRTLAKSR